MKLAVIENTGGFRFVLNRLPCGSGSCILGLNNDNC